MFSYNLITFPSSKSSSKVVLVFAKKFYKLGLLRTLTMRTWFLPRTLPVPLCLTRILFRVSDSIALICGPCPFCAMVFQPWNRFLIPLRGLNTAKTDENGCADKTDWNISWVYHNVLRRCRIDSFSNQNSLQRLSVLEGSKNGGAVTTLLVIKFILAVLI